MHLTQKVILVLTVIDIALLLLMPWIDGKLYRMNIKKDSLKFNSKK